MVYEYKTTNFLSTPVSGEKRIRIYDKNSNLKYSIEPNLSYFYVSNNCLVIKVTNKNDIILSFENSTESKLALSMINTVKGFFNNITLTHLIIDGGTPISN